MHTRCRSAPGLAGRVRTFSKQADRVARFAGALRRLGLRDGDRVAVLTLNPDRYGGTLVTVPAFEPAAVLHAIARHRATHMSLVPSMLRVLPDHAEKPLKRELRERYWAGMDRRVH